MTQATSIICWAGASDAEALAEHCHFEMLSNQETARVLGISKKAASNRYVRALERLKEIVGGFENSGDR